MTEDGDDSQARQRTTEWDAASYHRLSAPQFSWGRQVIDRLRLEGGETVMDAGCGTGRLTALLLERLPRGRVVAVDLSQNMLEEARSHLTPRFGGGVEFVRADLAGLPFDEAFDGVFSTAAFHWVPDHARLFRSLYASLKPGGWLNAQCGGGPNIARLMRRALVLTASEPYAPHFSGWKDTKVFADDVTTAERLRAAGFIDVETSLEPAPTILSGADEFREFLTTVNMHAHLARLPVGILRRRFVEELTEQAAADVPPYSLDYCRLNIRALRPREGGLDLTEFTYRGGDGWPLYATAVDSAGGPAAGGENPVLVLLHGGGPDHHSLVPLARQLSDRYAVVLPDVRGYGRSVCADPSRHSWAQYADDVIALLDHLGVRRAVVGGAGIGTTITLRAALAHPGRVSALVLISVEDIEDDEKKEAEIELLDAFAARVRAEGIEAAWEPILKDLAPIIGVMVRDAIPRSDPASIAAAAAIGRDRSFRTVDELAAVTEPTLIIPGMDERHPTALAEALARTLPQGRLATVALSADLRSADDFARAFAPTIRDFLNAVAHRL